MSDLLACPECHETGVVDYRGAAAKCPTCKGAKRIADRRSGKDRRATPSAEQKVGLWMPIETAPRDGTSVWITRADGYMVVARNWGGAWFKDSGAYASECTHWQPVPAALASSDR